MSTKRITLDEATKLFNEELKFLIASETKNEKTLSSIYKFILSKKNEFSDVITKMIVETDNCNNTEKIILPKKKGVNSEIASAILKNSIISVVETYKLGSDTPSILDYFIFEFLNNYTKKYKDKRKKLLNFLNVYDIIILEENVNNFPDFICKTDINVHGRRLKRIYLILIELENKQLKTERKSIFNIITEDAFYNSSEEYFKELCNTLYSKEKVISYYKIKKAIEKEFLKKN